ncbi:hypothetical protein UMM65_09745 [Aureibaculum sp. 2210JD6-5]|uniref:hypothetical protein n=1 Tax=Aureibaculum sp. 2210JD6-5 TaxID=3103957 RepID=UPI002AAD8B84|nr:hypothetical protein [Aureibaculum sp. 2210JD6-5]MDY7395524.1 hypothetical protein [Aureibaculum sp. 2210JD6-5]
MKINSYILLALIILLSFTNCKSTKGISIVQNKNNVNIAKDMEIVAIDKSPFSFYFKLKKYTENTPEVAKLAAFSNKNDLDALQIGLNINQTKCFDKGDALALRPITGYDALFIVDYGFHALYYDNPEDKSVELLSEKDGMADVAFHVNRLFTNEKYIEITEYELSEIYVALFIDTNYNETIDEGELTKFTIQFKN